MAKSSCRRRRKNKHKAESPEHLFNGARAISTIRKSSTGGLYELNDHLYEDRYSPTNAQDKREVRTRIDAEKAALKA